MKMKLVSNQKGSSLPVAILVCMLLAIGLMALQTSVMSFAQRTAVKHYDMQAYLSARNVATELANMLKEETDAYILTYNTEQRNEFDNFPTELKDVPEVSLDRPAEVVSWIHSLMDMNDGDVKEFGDFTWNRENVPEDFDLGSVSATITRNDSTEFEIAATCTVSGNAETVKVLLSCSEFEKEGSSTTTTIPPVVVGNANILYSDYGFGLKSGDEMENFEVAMPFVTSIPIYFSDNLGTYQDKIQSYGDIYIENFGEQKTGGAVVSRTNIYIAEQKVTNAYLHAEERITIGTNAWIDTGDKNMFAKLVYINGDNIRIGGGTIYAETVIIDATNLTMDADIIANEVQIVQGTTSTGPTNAMDIQTKTGAAYWVSEPHFTGISQELLLQFEDDSKNVAHLIQEIKGTCYVIDNVVYEEWVNGNKSYTATVVESGLDQMNLPDTAVSARYQPTWIDTSGMDAIPLEDVEGGWDKEGLIVGEGDHYYVVSDGSTYDGNKFSFGNGMFQNDNNADMGEGNGQYPLIFVVEDGATLYLSDLNQVGKDGLYVILKGNGKLRVSGMWYENMRVFGDAPSTDTHLAVVAAIDELVQEIQTDYNYENGNAPEGMVAEIQNAIRAEMVNNWSDELAMVILDDGALFTGTCVVPYFYSLGDELNIRGGRYPSDYVTDDDALSEGGALPELETEVTDPIKMLYVNIHTYSE